MSHFFRNFLQFFATGFDPSPRPQAPPPLPTSLLWIGVFICSKTVF